MRDEGWIKETQLMLYHAAVFLYVYDRLQQSFTLSFSQYSVRNSGTIETASCGS